MRHQIEHRRLDGIEIERSLDRVRDGVEAAHEVGLLHGLHQPEMPLRQGDGRIRRQRAEQGQAGTRQPRRDQADVPRARRAIEDDAGHLDVVAIAREPRRHRRRRLGLARHIEHEHHRPARERREIGGRAARRLAGFGHAVEQAHHPFDDGEMRGSPVAVREIEESRGRHRPAVEIEARPPRRSFMERGIEIVRPALEGLHGASAARKRADQAGSDGRLAGAGARRRHDQPARTVHHDQPTIDASARRRSVAIAPITAMQGEPMP